MKKGEKERKKINREEVRRNGNTNRPLFEFG